MKLQKIDGSESVIIIKDNHSYTMFLPPDMLAVKRFRTELEASLNSHGFPREDIEQIELACDEALTNSISANIKYSCQETIICKWKIENLKFNFLILDYGRGVPAEKITHIDKPNTLGELLERFKSTNSDLRQLPFSGVCKSHKNMGQGLNIIKKIMDKVSVFYHKNDDILESFSETAEGSILEMEFSSKKS